MTNRDHDFHELAVRRVVAETADSATIVLDVPPDAAASFVYRAGQFCTFKVGVGDSLYRCYSMSSAPGVDDALAVTVKRVENGVVSNHLLDTVAVGSKLLVSAPSGVFTLAADEGDFVGFAAGSGITPVISLVKTVLANTERNVRLLYANRDPDSVIFRRELDELAATWGGRVDVVHRFDVEVGFVDAAAVDEFLASAGDSAGFYLCGPTPFMDIVESTLLSRGVQRERIHLERFTSAGERSTAADDPDLAPIEADGCRITIELDGRTETADHHPGSTILQTARQLGMSPPFSCESGNCATCMGRLLEGTVEMHVNNALDDDEVQEGFILTCQSVPTSTVVSVRYGFD